MPRSTRPIAIVIGLAGAAVAVTGCSVAPPVDPDTNRYADGTYEAEGAYSSPAGPAHVTVSIKVSDDVVSWVHVAPGTFVGDPFEFQDKFAKAVPDLVVGKDLDLVTVSRVAGSSLTSQAFNQAIDAIKSEAIEP